MTAIMNLFLILYVMVMSTPPHGCTLSASDRKPTGGDIPSLGPVPETVHSRNLITKTPKVKDIVMQHSSYGTNGQHIKYFNQSTLAFVTPWNPKGYEISETFAHKFTHLSPVWLQMRMNDDEQSTRVEGTHDIDYQWMKKVRAANPNIKIVPRIVFDRWKQHHLHTLLGDTKLPGLIGRQLVDLAKQYELDGMVFEMWNTFTYQQRDGVITFLSKVYAHFKKHKLLLIMVIPPPLDHAGRTGYINRKDVERLAPYVHGFTVMTYDYSNPQRPGPNSPIKWVRECIKTLAPKENSPIRKKLLMGLNFYGFDYTPQGGSHIVGHEFVSIVSKYKPKFIWDEVTGEHHFEYKADIGRNRVFYPTLASIDERINLLSSMGTGISIWEIGQGLDYFYDLF